MLIIVTPIFILQSFTQKQEKQPWSEKQLMHPSELAKIITSENKTLIYIFNIGPAGRIKNSINIGAGKDKNNIKKLKNEVSALPKDANIVIYCGCCPFKDCPNIRPAFTLLNEQKFKNPKLLNLTKNLKADWIDKGFPMNDKKKL
ncbi:MAG: rhodanese-like domain-containing protein [Chitinophagaceae bacterium]|nr:MAG: rhodanese-like domain-containing protein [Chitinophagaceae bacterium]